MHIRYSDTTSDLEGLLVANFFQGWPTPPSSAVLKKSILNADYVSLAIDDETQQLVGYVTAISDNTLSAYIPFLEVIPAYQRQGIGHALMERILAQLSHLYMIDVVCDTDVASFYAEAGFKSWHAMIKRNYANLGDGHDAN